MNYTKHILIGLGVLALAAIIATGAYAASYFSAERAAVELQTTVLAQQAALTTPTITISDAACDIAPNAKTQSYSIDIRTDDAKIAIKQEQVLTLLRGLGATITSSNRGRQKDMEAGYSTVAQVQATLPIAQTATFISQLKAGIVAPDYSQNEYSSTLGFVWVKQSCQSSLSYLKNAASAEALYLNQLSTMQGSSDTSTQDAITQKLTETRQNAISYEASLDSLLSQINTTQIVVNVSQIPG